MSSSTILSYVYRPQTFFKERQLGAQNLSRIVKNIIAEKELHRHHSRKSSWNRQTEALCWVRAPASQLQYSYRLMPASNFNIKN